ncbi:MULTISPECIES: glycosyltransferase family 2 protein [unclassified Nitratiruptor]|uniref:glycosyltransferase family 2 protein n=1 Tax=unclassified Nitratiruptor TaxID=2624044 RepID=UPI00191521C8|nr:MULTISPECIES: glycosyltransferase family 2 protein [unclassified Nitratiruptor]BCD60164.1 glycosyl transferase, family 2 [Nitratiruptor sp. YY08-10]BCD64347.1 glycosyl transferase, family 2 [Nitratiruptor sp. YY08-14]
MKLSVVIPVMNEEENIEPLMKALKEALQGLDYELIFVDDGSTDGTVEKIKELADERTKLIVFNRNFGQSLAMAAGIDAATGDVIATIDGDLQNDPRDIPLMLEKMQNEGWDVVAGVRANRQDGLVLRKIPSKIANWIIRRSTGVYLHDYGCTLKLFKKDVAKNLGLYGELHRFIPVLAKLYGAKMTEMDVRHHPRLHGESKYGIGRTFKVISDLMLMLFFQKYGTKPMHLFGTLGFGMFGIGMLINFYLFMLKLFGHDIGGRPLLILGVMLTLGGIQLITTGFLAEIMMRTYYESQNKKPYVIKEIYEGSKS